MTRSLITVYGAHWCPDCRRSKQFLGEHQIPYQWVDIEEDSQAEQFVIEKNKGKPVAVVGGGNSAAEESLLLTKFAEHVTILVRGAHFKATQFIQDKVLSHPKIDVRWHTEVKAFTGAQSKLKKLIIADNQIGKEEELEVDGAFIFIGLTPNTGFLEGSDILLDRWGFVVTGHALLYADQRPALFKGRDPFLLETSIPGIFAAGDVRDASTKQVVSAAGEGSTAALEIREYLKNV